MNKVALLAALIAAHEWQDWNGRNGKVRDRSYLNPSNSTLCAPPPPDYFVIWAQQQLNLNTTIPPTQPTSEPASGIVSQSFPDGAKPPSQCDNLYQTDAFVACLKGGMPLWVAESADIHEVDTDLPPRETVDALTQTHIDMRAKSYMGRDGTGG